MNLKEALKIARKFGFKKVAVPTAASGCEHLFHYFSYDYHGIGFMLSNEGDDENIWYGSILNSQMRYYISENFEGVLWAIIKGTPHES